MKPKSESDYKHIIRDTINEELGGYAVLLEGLYQKGIPDMFLSVPSAWPCLAEVKVERKCGLVFDRKLDYSKLQIDHLAKLHLSNLIAALGLCVCEIDGDAALVALPPTAERISSKEMHAFVWLMDNKRFDMDELFMKYRKAYINPQIKLMKEREKYREQCA